MSDFYTIAKQVADQRIKDDYYDRIEKQTSGEYIYSNFCCYCNAYPEFNRTKTADFNKFLKQENITLNFWQKKHLLTKYFNYEFKFDYNTNKWLTKQITI